MSRTLFACSLATIGAFGATTCAAQGYPDQPIRFVVPYGPGGGADLTTRLIQPKLAELLGQPVVVDNRPGASGNIGAELVSKATPDGYTILMATANLTMAPSVFSKLAFDPVKDFAAISLLSKAPSILAVTPSFPAKSVKELIALAKASPGKINYASDGGGPLQLGVELFKKAAGVNLTNIPYKSTGPAAVAVVSGEASVLMAPAIAVIPHAKAGRLRALAVTSAQRLDAVPDLPTVAESGVPDFEVNQWYGVLAPAGTPAPIVASLNERFVKIMQTPEIKSKLRSQASVPLGSTPQEFAQFLKEDIKKWAAATK